MNRSSEAEKHSDKCTDISYRGMSYLAMIWSFKQSYVLGVLFRHCNLILTLQSSHNMHIEMNEKELLENDS